MSEIKVGGAFNLDPTDRLLDRAASNIGSVGKLDMSRNSKSSALNAFEAGMGQLYDLMDQWAIALRKDKSRRGGAIKELHRADKKSSQGFSR